MARPDELTQEVADALLDKLRRCLYVDTACAAVGIERTTLRNWMQRARRAVLRKQRHDEEISEADAPHVALMNAMSRVTAERQVDLVEMVTAAGTEDWRAAMAVLSARWPDQWSSLRPELRERDKREAALLAEVEQLRARLAAMPVQVGQVVEQLPAPPLPGSDGSTLPGSNGTSHGPNGTNGTNGNGNGKH